MKVSRSTLWAIAVLAVVFAAGITTGVMLQGGDAPNPPATSPTANRFNTMIDELQLSDVQRREIDQIVYQWNLQKDAAIDQSARRLNIILDSMRLEIEAVLTPPHKAVFDSLAGPEQPPTQTPSPNAPSYDPAR